MTKQPQQPRVRSEAMREFAQALSSRPTAPGKVNLDPENVKKGLARLLLALIKLLHELLERQAIRRVESGKLRGDQVERLGLTLQRQAEQLEHLRQEFGLSKEELNLDLGPLGRLFSEE